MDDESPYDSPTNLKSNQSSSESTEMSPSSSSKQVKKKKKKKQRQFGVRTIHSSSSSDNDDQCGKVNDTTGLSESEDCTGKVVGLTTSSGSSIHQSGIEGSCSKTSLTSSGSSPIMKPRMKAKGVTIDSDDSSSSEFIAGPVRRNKRRVVESTSASSPQSLNSHCASRSDDEPMDHIRPERKNKLSSTESSDEDDSPSCAICLSSLLNRIAAQISGCSHEFHNTCILKWAERTNTCPIDRSKFNKITVKNKQGKVVKITEVDDKEANVVEEEEMFPIEIITCVMCGSPDNEDILLLCDGCNQAFHTYCLDPPLNGVPEGNWICQNCSPLITLRDSVYFNNELDISIEDYSDNSGVSEMEDVSENELSDQPSTSTRRARNGGRADTLTVSVSSRNRNVSRNTRVRQTTITIKQTRKRKKRRMRRRTRRNLNQRSTVSSRNRSLAMAAAKRMESGQARATSSDGVGGRQRLSLFSSDQFEDYYNPDGDSDIEGESGPVAVTARARYPTARIMDRKSAVARLINTNRRPRIATRVIDPGPIFTAPSSVNVLDDILGMMDTEIKKTSGKIPIRLDGTFATPEKVDVNADKNKDKVISTPGYPGGNMPNRTRGHYGGSGGGYHNPPPARHQAGPFSTRGGIAPSFPPRFPNFLGGNRPINEVNFFRTPPPRYRSHAPPRFPRRSLPSSLLIDPEMDQEDPSQPEEDVDIYGDIDSTPQRTSFSTSLEPPPQPPAGLLDLGPPPEPPAALLGMGSPRGPSDDNLVIDDNEYDPAEPCDSPEIENVPSISSDESPSEDLDSIPIPDKQPPVHSCAPPPPDFKGSESDEDCPNSSLYSSTSLAFARKKAARAMNANSDEKEEVAEKEEDKSVLVRNTPIRFSIGSRNLVPAESTKSKIDLFTDYDSDEEDNEEKEEDDKEEVEEIERNIDTPDDGENKDNDNGDGKNKKDDEDEREAEALKPISIDDDESQENVEALSLNSDDKNSDIDIVDEEKLLNGSTEHLENISGEIIDGIRATDDSIDSDNVTSSIAVKEITDELKNDGAYSPSFEMSPDTTDKNEKSIEDEIFGSDKEDDVEVDKDELSTHGDILDLNTENLHGVSDVHNLDGSLTENDKIDEELKIDEDTRSKNDSFNCLDGLDVDPISDSEYGSLSDEMQSNEDKDKNKRKKKKRKTTDREEGEIIEPKKKDRKKDENNENEKKYRKKKDKDKEREFVEFSPLQEKTVNISDNFDKDQNESVSWKKLSKNTKDRNYRDKDETKSKNRKETRKEIERYNVRKIIGEKAYQRKDEFGRDLTPLSRSGSRSMGKSPRKKSLSRDRSRSPIRKNKRKRSRSVSIQRFRGRRSFSRSPVRGRKRRSRSPSIVKPKGKFQKKGVRSRSRSRRRSPRKERSRSRSKPKRRSRSREKPKNKNRKEKNYEPPSFKGNKGKKKKKQQLRRSPSVSKTKKRSKSPRGHSPWEFSSTSISRSPSPLAPVTRQSRSWSRDNNLTVIVPNMKKKEKKKAKEGKRRKHRDDQSPTLSKEVFTSGDNILVSVNFAHAEKNSSENVQVEKVKAPKKSKKDVQALKAAKIREMAAKAKPVAIIDLDVSPFRERTPSPKEVIVLDTESDEESGKQPELKAPSGPKTPPEPCIKFSINSKNQAISTIVNPLLDNDDNGPNTPEAPSPPTSPYDPFDPTKSRSPSPISQSAPNENNELKPGNENLEKTQLDMLKPGTPIKDSTASPSKVVNGNGDDLNQNSNSKQDDKLATSSTGNTLSSNLSTFTSALSGNNNRNNMNGNTMDDILDLDSDGVYSPASSIGDDLFDPPQPSKKSPAKSKFDSLFVSKNTSKAIPSYEPKHSKTSAASGHKKSAKYTPTKSKQKPISKLDEDQLKILDEVPSSAVEMQVKYKYLKKLNRQERVIEEVKIVLKPHYNKKHVTKEQYKDILRKCVPKVCHNKNGEINPSKIHTLVEAYVKKYRIHNKRGKGGGGGGAGGASSGNTTNASSATNNVLQNSVNNINNNAKKSKNMWS